MIWLSGRYSLAIILAFLVVGVPTVLAKPSFFEEKNPQSELAELESMFSGKHSDAGSSQEIVSLFGGQAKPVQPNPMDALYDVPYQDYFRNNTIFSDFLMELDGNLTMPQINNTQREMYLGGFGDSPSSAKGRMTKSQRPPQLKPLLIDEPIF
jgi:hypothetical protein